MKLVKLLLWFFLATFLICSPVQAEKENIDKFDGHTWAEWGPIQKHSFIAGFISASSYVFETNASAPSGSIIYDKKKAVEVWLSTISKKNKKNIYTREEVLLLEEYINRLANAGMGRHLIMGITNGQISSGLDLLFADFRNKQIKVRDAIYVVKRQIEGASSDEIEAILLYLRSSKDFAKLFYKDKDGKNEWASFP